MADVEITPPPAAAPLHPFDVLLQLDQRIRERALQLLLAFLERIGDVKIRAENRQYGHQKRGEIKMKRGGS